MTTEQQLQQQLQKGLNDPRMPVNLRLTDYPTQATVISILAEYLRPPAPQPPPRPQRTTYAAMSAAKYD